jgi:hypothetical protein
MNVTNRKMFRPRNARNKLNQMGGIMASSPELMQTIQRFELGGGVRPGARPTVMGMGSGDLPNVSQIMDFLGLSSPTETQSSSVEVDPTLAEMQRANDPRFFNRLGANLATLPAAAYDTAVGLPAAAVQNAATAFQYSPFGRALGLSEPGAQQPPYVGSQVAQPALQNIFAENVPLTPEQVAAAAASEIPQTMENPSFADISKRVAAGELPEDVFVPSGSRLAAGTNEAPKPRSSLLVIQGTPKDIAKTQELANNLFDRTFGDLVNKETSKDKPTKSDAYAALPSTSNKENIQKDPEAALSFGAKIDAVAKEFLGSNADENDKNDLILELTGRKDPQKSMSMKDRYKENLELYREVFGKNPEEERKIDGYNLAMMGFLIASGDSPNALQNIARGAAAGVERIQKTAEARKARDEKLKLAALQRAATQEDAETERQTTWAQTVYKDTREGKRAQDKMKFDLAKLNIELKQKEELANDKAVNDQTRADANNEATLLRTMINNYGELGNLAATQLMTQGFDPKKIFTPEGFKTLTNTMEDLAKRFPELSRTSQKSMDPGKSREAFVRDRQEEFDDNVDYQDLMSDRLGKPVSDITPEDITMYAMRQFNVEQSASPTSQSASPTSQSASPTSQSASPTSQFVLGQIITQGSNRFRVTGINSDGTPITEPVQ